MSVLNYLLTQCLGLTSNYKASYLQQSIIDGLPNYYIFWKDKNSIFLGCNKAFANLAGLDSPEKIIGKNDYDFSWSKEDSNKFIIDDKLVMEGKRAKLNVEETHILPEGEKVVLLTSKIPLIDENDEVYGILGICSNVTQQKLEESNVREINQKLEHAYQEARHLQDSLMDYLPNYFIFWKDINGKYMGCNQAFAELAGQKSPSDLIGKSDYDYWSKEESDLYVADDRMVMTSNKLKLNIEEPQTTPWDKKIILSTSKVPLIDEKGKVYGLLGICSDITQQKLIEQNTYMLNLRLEEECESKSQLIENLHQIITSPIANILQTEEPPFDDKMDAREIFKQAFKVWKSANTLMGSLKQIIEENR